MIRSLLLTACVFAAAVTAEAQTYTIDPVHASVVFRVKHLETSYFYGVFKDVKGSFVLDDDPSKCSVEVEVKAGSVDTNNPGRDKHVKGPDFFSAGEFPTITFKSTKVAAGKDGMLDVTGTLTLHGVSKEITVQVELTGKGRDMKGKEIAGAACTFRVQRSEFGMTKLIPAVSDEIVLMLAVEGMKK